MLVDSIAPLPTCRTGSVQLPPSAISSIRTTYPCNSSHGQGHTRASLLKAPRASAHPALKCHRRGRFP
ncbi:hypothetical protein J6590_019120 [Homalodisca vitripennis]|nr:hypothetical protein J6590_019120 [Homalodisca vitripennis]